ncbi:hypothetical protein OROGR_008738 [Orobanche gracilis]
MMSVEYSKMRHCNYKPKKDKVEERSLSAVVIEDGDFPEDPDWFLVERTVVTGLSTTRGRKLENNEIVHFAFPNVNARTKSSTHFMSAKAANAASSIVRFSTKRFGEIGRLPMEWSKCLVPLVHSSKVKVLGRCVAAPVNLQLMQELMLYVSFYIHHSIFSEGDKSSWKLEPTNIDSTIYPLLKLFNLLKVNPFHKAEFTPEELSSRKRSLNLDDDNDTISVLPLAKKRNGCQRQDHDKTEQVISEASLNKLVGAVDMYNLEEMEPAEILSCDLRPYQKQALYWMSELEAGADAEETGKTLHPCWAAYRVCDEKAPAIYVNVFSGEATTQFPTATQMARGGILADAMGLGKTVMTIESLKHLLPSTGMSKTCLKPDLSFGALAMRFPSIDTNYPVEYQPGACLALDDAVTGTCREVKRTWYTEGCPSKIGFLAVIFLGLYIIVYSPGMGTAPWIVNSEIYPLKYRSLGGGIAAVSNWSSNLIVNETFLTLTEHLGFAGTFLLFAGFLFIGLVSIFFLVPETKGLQFAEVEKLLEKGYSPFKMGEKKESKDGDYN